MGLKEILKKQGYTDEQIQAVEDAMKENGIYVSSVENPKETIDKLQQDYEHLQTEYENLKTSSKDNESASETIRKLQDEVNRGKIETAAIIELTKAGALDVDYLMFKAEKSGEFKKLSMDENGKVAGVDELVSSLKKNHAAQFTDQLKPQEALVRTGIKKLEETAAPDDEPKTLEEAIAQKLSGENE